jgi:hypothetical protein
MHNCKILSAGYGGGPPLSPFAKIATSFAIAMLISLFIVLVFSAHSLRAASRAQIAESIATENRIVCGSFGIAPGSDAYAGCVEALAGVRRFHEDRKVGAFSLP